MLASTPMPAWFDRAFGPWYVRLYSHRDREEAGRTLRTLAPWTGAGPVLDVACGSGRHLDVLLEGGTPAVGLDRSGPLLAAAPPALRGRLVRGDMRELPFPDRSFRTLLCLFTSFGYFETDEAHTALLREFARVTGSGGRLILDLPNPARLREALVHHSVRRIDDHEIHERRRVVQRLPRDLVIKEIAIERPGAGIVETYREEVTLYDPETAGAMLDAAGWRVVTALGDYDGSAFEPRSPRYLAVAEKEAS